MQPQAPGAAHDHRVAFYRDPAALGAALADYAIEGLRGGEAVILIARDENARAVSGSLASRGIDGEAAARDGQLVVLQAQTALERIAPAGKAQRDRFLETVAGPLDRAAAKFGRVRVFGEIVDLLWTAGRPDDAISLEQLWEGLLEERGFPLLCGYGVGKPGGAADQFTDVCRLHSCVLPLDEEALRADRARLLRENALLAEAARDAEAMRDEFLFLASHELKTPLTSLQLAVQSLELAASRGTPIEPSLLQKRTSKVSSSATRLTRVVDTLLEVSRASRGHLALHRSRCDLAALVREVADGIAPRARREGSTVTLDLPASLEGNWDQSRLAQTLAGLLSNAVNYGGGKPIEVTAGREGATAVVRVRDHGRGIPLADQQRIFERFQRAVKARNHGGLGLGLWFAREVMQAHGGSLTVQSEEGRGATFTAVLPL